MTAQTMIEVEMRDPLTQGAVRRRIAAEVVAPGLAIHAVHATTFGHRLDRWAITHVPSGRRLPITYYDPTTARRVALELAMLGDWTVPAEQLTDLMVGSGRALLFGHLEEAA